VALIGGPWGRRKNYMDGHSKYIQSGKTKEILYKAVIFRGESLHCGYKENLKKLGKFVSIV
jgi:hypothetical protein